MSENFPGIAKYVDDIYIKQPWVRMFETDVKLKISYKD